MNKKKLSPAQQILIAAIAGKTLTYRIVSLWRGGTTTKTLVDIEIGGQRPEIKVRLSTIDALAATGDVILTCVDHGNRAYTVVLPEVETPEVETPEFETPEFETPEVEAPASETKIWPEKREMSKYGYAVMQVKDCIAGYTYYVVTDYKPASLVGSYSPEFVCRASVPEEAIAAAKALEETDMSLSRAWRACKIWQARKGLRKSKGVEHNTPVPVTPELKKSAHEEEIGLFHSLIKEGQYVLAEVVIRKLINDTAADDKIHRHSLGTVLLAQGKKEEAREVFFSLSEVLVEQGREEEAKQPLWEIIINCPDESSTAYARLGKLCEELGQYSDAIAVYTTAITDTGPCEDYLYGLHRTHLAMGDEFKAQEYLVQAQSLADEREIAMGRCIPTGLD